MSTAVSETRVARSADRIFTLPEKARQRPGAALAMVLGVAALVFIGTLGRSSMFIDEVFSWNASRHGLSGVGDAVRGAEVTPPLYYVLLHFWIAITGASGEAMLRLPSALAGVGFVGAVAWLGTVVENRRTGLIAAALAALSPLTLQYAQEVRAYVFVMLAVTVTAAAAVMLTKEPDKRRWLVLTVVAGAVAVLLHYTAVLVLFPLAVWLLREKQVSVPARALVVAAFVIPILALLPLLATQLGAGHHNQSVDAYARITSTGLLRLIATPFDGRALLMGTYQLGFLVIVDAIALMALSDRFRHVKTRWLLVSASVIPILAIIGVSAVIHPFAITRYTTVATPFMLVTLAVVAGRVPKALGIALVSLALIGSIVGTVAAMTPNGQWPDLRTAMRETAQRAHKGDLIIGLNNVQFAQANQYYDTRNHVATLGFPTAKIALQSPMAKRALRRHHSIFLVSWPPQTRKEVGDANVVSDRRYHGMYRLQVAEIRK